MELSALHMPQELMLPTCSYIRLPVPSATGRFIVTPDELWGQLIYGQHNPGYGNKPLSEVIEHVDAWRSNVVKSDIAASEGREEMFGQHMSNAMARIVCVPDPLRSSTFSLKNAYQQEERHFPRQLTGRDPEELSIIYNSLCSLRKRSV